MSASQSRPIRYRQRGHFQRARSRAHIPEHCKSAYPQDRPYLQIPYAVLQVLVLQQQQVHPLFEVTTLRPLQVKAQLSATKNAQALNARVMQTWSDKKLTMTEEAWCFMASQ